MVPAGGYREGQIAMIEVARYGLITVWTSQESLPLILKRIAETAPAGADLRSWHC